MFILVLVQKLRVWLRYRDILEDLSLRSDRELADVGFERHDLKRIARGAAEAEEQNRVSATAAPDGAEGRKAIVPFLRPAQARRAAGAAFRT